MNNPIDLKAAQDQPGWEVFSYSGNIVQMHIPIDGQIKVKSFCTLSKGKKEIFAFISRIEEIKLIFDDLTPKGTSYSFRLKLPLGVCKRIGTVSFNNLENEEGVVLRSIDEDFKQEEGIVRAEINYMGFLIEEIGMNMSKLTFLCDLSLGGTPPELAIEGVKKHLAQVPRQFKDRIKNKHRVNQ